MSLKSGMEVPLLAEETSEGGLLFQMTGAADEKHLAPITVREVAMLRRTVEHRVQCGVSLTSNGVGCCRITV